MFQAFVGLQEPSGVVDEATKAAITMPRFDGELDVPSTGGGGDGAAGAAAEGEGGGEGGGEGEGSSGSDVVGKYAPSSTVKYYVGPCPGYLPTDGVNATIAEVR